MWRGCQFSRRCTISLPKMIPEFKDKENYDLMQRGELYYPFAHEFLAARRKCAKVCRRFNQSEDITRRQMVKLWNEYVIIQASLAV